ncbi:MAG: hypothetical protein Q7S29_01470 [Candidatus Peribacter sp.]|nr:hypothetical protein [Candidatus Peribacter sp.]
MNVIRRFIDGQYIRYCLLALLLLGCAMESRDVWQRIAVEFHTRTDDFLIAGRAILNGYIPYKDHLDVKAPGAIFIGALSLLVTGDYRFEWALKIGMLLAIPVLMMILTFRGARTQHGLLKWLLMASAFLMGSEFMLYTVARGGNNLNNAEPFGIFFALLYLLTIAWDREKVSRLRIGLASLFLLCTIGIKEPFLFTLLAMSLVLSRNTRFFTRTFLIPLGIAMLSGTLILAVLGYLIPYLTVDIPTILGDRMTAPSSLQFRGLMSFRIVEDITQYSPVGPMMGYFVLLLWSTHPLFKFEDSRKHLWMASVAVFLLSSFVYFSGIFWIVWERLHYTFSIQSSLVQWLIIKYIASLVLVIPLLWMLFSRSKKLFGAVLLSGIALYLTTIAIGSGSFLAQHFLLAVPVYAGLFVLFSEQPKFLFPLFLIALAPFFHPKTDYAQLTRSAEDAAFYSTQYKSIAAEADRLMDRCNFEQYYALGGIAGINTYTKHSPTDLAYAEVSDNAALRKRFMERLQMAPVIFTDDDYLQNTKDADVRATLEKYFAQEPSACAQDFAFTDHRMIMLFRKDSEDPMASPPPELPKLQLKHFIEEINGQSPMSAQELKSITRTIVRELGLNVTEDSTTILVRMEKKSIRLTIQDISTSTVLGVIVVNRADGTILSKSTAAQP